MLNSIYDDLAIKGHHDSSVNGSGNDRVWGLGVWVCVGVFKLVDRKMKVINRDMIIQSRLP